MHTRRYESKDIIFLYVIVVCTRFSKLIKRNREIEVFVVSRTSGTSDRTTNGAMMVAALHPVRAGGHKWECKSIAAVKVKPGLYPPRCLSGTRRASLPKGAALDIAIKGEHPSLARTELHL